MSAQSNVVAQLKGLLHSVGANTNDSKGAVDNTLLRYVTFFLGGGDAGDNALFLNSKCTFVPTGDMKLESVKMSNPTIVTNVSGDDIIITVTCNGATVVTYNTNASANGSANIAADSVTDLGINTANSFVNAGTQCRVAWTQADRANNNLQGVTFTLALRPI